ncbi:hypothetical protein ACE1AT_13240 [Pelatocladus sp. BLCC-F211]|uniref:hypothetical protein n=1 Tax=Pelatocladus sp. BLCC-F211 TaxID=3342752 RepID=UPI0035B76552
MNTKYAASVLFTATSLLSFSVSKATANPVAIPIAACVTNPAACAAIGVGATGVICQSLGGCGAGTPPQAQNQNPPTVEGIPLSASDEEGAKKECDAIAKGNKKIVSAYAKKEGGRYWCVIRIIY